MAEKKGSGGQAGAGRVVTPWRTEVYRRLAQPLGAVLGGPTARALESLKLRTVADLLGHLPRRYLAGTETTDLGGLEPGEDVAVVAMVSSMGIRQSHSKTPVRGGRERLEVVLTDGTGFLLATFFGREHLLTFWQKQLSRGVKGIFVGKVGVFRGQLQMTHPNFVMLDSRGHIVGRASQEKSSMAAMVSRSGLVGIYPASSKIPTWRVGECANFALQTLDDAPDPMPAELRERLGLLKLLDAYSEIHRPDSLAGAERGVARLKFDEALALQVTMAFRRADASRYVAVAVQPRDDRLLAAFDTRLPFKFTAGQQAVSDEIFADLARPRPMQRLLQGEVGSGKTVVALRAMLAEVDAGGQAALLAPTEVLAWQHLDSIRALLGDLGDGQVLGAPDHATEVVLLTGSMTAAQKREAQAKIADGRAGIVIGTHALLSEQVVFDALGLVVVDEQHRFGVEQRAVLQRKAALAPHLLVLTATPIPRSIAMTVFGDLEVSTLREVPAGRQDVQTTVVSLRRHPTWLGRAWERIGEEVARGRQVFIVCPRISISDADVFADDDHPPSAAVDELHAQLARGPLRHLSVGKLHSKLTTAEKDATMAAFTAGELDVLVATTVIEVGVDAPNASMMVIMDADRFGISQLHQLRGRIGRGAHPGVCLLVTHVDANSGAGQRLAAVAASRDGFELAEVDLQQRREGDVLGSTQTGGRSTLRLLSVLDDADLIAQTRQIAEELVAADPDRSSDWLADLVTATEMNAAADWLERS
ncbi:ATP-dependent DNA helicase RecG [Brooklawnia sp.]|uniref:ATP-dependent DNA helicase RecG n=1 Tax=Brooklawnia sp. TaxID=2699740 RepID=UPI003C766E61